MLEVLYPAAPNNRVEAIVFNVEDLQAYHATKPNGKRVAVDSGWARNVLQVWLKAEGVTCNLSNVSTTVS